MLGAINLFQQEDVYLPDTHMSSKAFLTRRLIVFMDLPPLMAHLTHIFRNNKRRSTKLRPRTVRHIDLEIKMRSIINRPFQIL